MPHQREKVIIYISSLPFIRLLRDKIECFLKSSQLNISDEALTEAIVSKNNDT